MEEYLRNVYCIILLLNYKLDRYNMMSILLYNNMSSMVIVDIGIDIASLSVSLDV